MHRLVRTRVAWPLLVLALASLVLAPSASAAPVLDSTYTSATTTSGCGSQGQTDANGVYYAMCGAKIVRWDKNGAAMAALAVPTGVVTAYDVAPSPDGAYLYVSQDSKAPKRLNRQANGTYALDAKWALANLVVWNTSFPPFGRFIETDGRGDIYLSNGSITESGQRSIAKYAPDGKFITAFGDYGKQDGFWITNQGIAVSRDGRRVYVGENCGTNCIYGTAGYDASRVTRYDYSPGGTYKFTRIITTNGAYAGKSFPECEAPGAVHSGYGVTMDYWGDLFVTSTTCGRIQMFSTDADPAKDRFVRSIVAWDDQSARNHYVGSDWAGRIHALQWNMIFTPKAPKIPTTPLPALEPLPEPDVTAPVLRSITLPASSTTRTVEIAVDATDDNVVAEMQLAREDGEWGAWQPFAKKVSYELSDGLGVKGVYVRVRDMAGNESNAVYKTLSVVAPVEGGGGGEPAPVGDKADPVVVSATVPALTPTRTVNVTVDATDDTGVRAVRFANEDGNWGAWKAFAAVSEWQLSAGNGAKAVYAQVRDGAGRESNVVMVRTSVQPDAPAQPPAGGGGEPDTTAPALTAFTIPAETTAQSVTAKLTATDDKGVAQVRFANEDGNWTGWQDFAAQKAWKLSDGYGAKLVYAQVRDATGNESLVLTARSSYVKVAQPAGPADAADPALVSVVLPATTKARGVGVALEATDDIGVVQVRFANEDGEWAAWQPYAANVTQQLTAGTGYKVVYAQVRDAAGRESNVLFARTEVVA
jgi:hypothetical protein